MEKLKKGKKTVVMLKLQYLIITVVRWRGGSVTAFMSVPAMLYVLRIDR